MPATNDCPARHCWVTDAPDRQGQPRPGLLVEWRRADSASTPEARAGQTSWLGRVLYVAELTPGQWTVLEEWVAEARLKVADAF